MKKKIFYSLLCLPMAGIALGSIPMLTSCSKTKQPGDIQVTESKLINLPIQEAKIMFGENNVNEVGNNVEISGFDSNAAKEHKTIVFPQKINNKPVVYNGNFKNNFKEFTYEIEVPPENEKQTIIENLYLGDEQAFEFICINQNELEDPNSNKGFTETYFKLTLKKLVVGGNVKKIPSLAFQYCKLLEEVTISDDVFFIEQSAFKSCTNIKNIKFNTKSNVWIDSQAFLFTKSQGPVKPTETTAELPTRTIEFGNMETFLILGNNDNPVYKKVDKNSNASKTFWSNWWLFDTTSNIVNIKCKQSLKNEINSIAEAASKTLTNLNFI